MTDNLGPALAGIENATEADLMPRVVMTAVHHGVEISIVEPCWPQWDAPSRRGYLWIAVIGEVHLAPAWIASEDMYAVGGMYAGEMVTSSRKSARTCMANARAVLNARARTARLQADQ